MHHFTSLIARCADAPVMNSNKTGKNICLWPFFYTTQFRVYWVLVACRVANMMNLLILLGDAKEAVGGQWWLTPILVRPRFHSVDP